MSSNVVNILLNIIAAVILAALAYVLSFLFPDMHNDLRMLISGLAAIVVLVIWHYVISPRFKRFTGWLGRIWAGLSNRTKAIFESIKTGLGRFRACLRGELEQCHSELKAEREKHQEERAKVDKLTLRLATLSQYVLSLFDESMEKPDGLEWDGALAASERAAKCARAALCHHVTKIVYYDPSYPASWMKGENSEKTRDYFVGRWFLEKNAQQLRDWVHEVLKSGLAYRSLIVFAQDIVPDTVAEVPNKTCLLRRYLDAGGRVVWRGNIPFWLQGKAGGAEEEWSKDGPWGVLGIYYYNYLFRREPDKQGGGHVWDSDLPSEVTQMGKEIGLTYSGKCTRPVECQDVDVTYVLIPQENFTIVDIPECGRGGGDFALCWKKNFCERYPHSGFIQFVLGKFLWRDDTTASFFKFAVSGWPLVFD